jgi:hypothetical protein
LPTTRPPAVRSGIDTANQRPAVHSCHPPLVSVVNDTRWWQEADYGKFFVQRCHWQCCQTTELAISSLRIRIYVQKGIYLWRVPDGVFLFIKKVKILLLS